jgi:hypothetical protein
LLELELQYQQAVLNARVAAAEAEANNPRLGAEAAFQRRAQVIELQYEAELQAAKQAGLSTETAEANVLNARLANLLNFNKTKEDLDKRNLESYQASTIATLEKVANTEQVFGETTLKQRENRDNLRKGAINELLRLQLKAIEIEQTALNQRKTLGLDDPDELNAQQNELNAKRIKSEQDTADKIDAIDKASKERRRESFKAVAATVAQTASTAIGIIDELFKAQSERQLAAVDDQKKRVQELSESGAITAKEASRRLAKLDQEEKKIKTEQAKRDKAVALFQAVVNTASAIVEALPNIPLSIIAGVTGAAQIALIAARPIPKFAKGKKDSYQGLAEVGEQGPEVLEIGKVRYLAQKPTIVWLGKEDKVYTHSETKKMLAGDIATNNVTKQYNDNRVSQSEAITNYINQAVQHTLARKQVLNISHNSEQNQYSVERVAELVQNQISRNTQNHFMSVAHRSVEISTHQQSAQPVTALPSIDKSITTNSQYNNQPQAAQIDYDKMAKSIATALPKYGLDIDEQGFTEWVEKQNAFTKYLDKRRAV